MDSFEQQVVRLADAMQRLCIQPRGLKDHETISGVLINRQASEPGVIDPGRLVSEHPTKEEAQLRLARALLVAAQGAQPMHRHRKRGTVYAEIARGELQSSRPVHEGERIVTYRGSDGRCWQRPESEFDDGRFERLPA